MCIRDRVHGSNAEQVLQDAEGCAVMQELGRNMAWLLHCIEADKQELEENRRSRSAHLRVLEKL